MLWLVLIFNIEIGRMLVIVSPPLECWNDKQLSEHTKYRCNTQFYKTNSRWRSLIYGSENEKSRFLNPENCSFSISPPWRLTMIWLRGYLTPQPRVRGRDSLVSLINLSWEGTDDLLSTASTACALYGWLNINRGNIHWSLSTLIMSRLRSNPCLMTCLIIISVI